MFDDVRRYPNIYKPDMSQGSPVNGFRYGNGADRSPTGIRQGGFQFDYTPRHFVGGTPVRKNDNDLRATRNNQDYGFTGLNSPMSPKMMMIQQYPNQLSNPYFSPINQSPVNYGPYYPSMPSPTNNYSQLPSIFPAPQMRQGYLTRSHKSLRNPLVDGDDDGSTSSAFISIVSKQSSLLQEIANGFKQEIDDKHHRKRQELEDKIMKLELKGMMRDQFEKNGNASENTIIDAERDYTSRMRLKLKNQLQQLAPPRSRRENDPFRMRQRYTDSSNDLSLSNQYSSNRRLPNNSYQNGSNVFDSRNDIDRSAYESPIRSRVFDYNTRSRVFPDIGSRIDLQNQNSKKKSKYRGNAGSKLIDEDEDEAENMKNISRTKKKTATLSKIFSETDVSENKKSTVLDNKLASAERRKKLAAFGWVIAYTYVLKQEVRRVARVRKNKRATIMITEQQKIAHLAQEFIKNAIFKELEFIYKESKMVNVACVVDNKKFNEKDANLKIKEYFVPKLRRLFDQLISYTNENTIPHELLGFMASISENNCVPPPNFYTEFELKRLKFSEFGTIKGVTDKTAKLVIGMFLFVRVLIFEIVLYPWSKAKDFVQGIRYNALVEKNLKTFASILHIVFNDYIRSVVPVDLKSQADLSAEDKIKPMPGGRLIYIPEMEDPEEIRKRYPPKDEAVAGLYTKEELYVLFKNNKAEADQLKAYVDHWLDKLHKITNSYYKKNRSAATMIQV